MSVVPQATRRLPYLEGLRAVAALWVVLSHTWISQFGIVTQTGALGWASNWLVYSHLAVDVFIVLSGFCLTIPLVRDGTLRGGVWSFWKRRARRILPPCYFALAAAIAITVCLRYLTTHVWSVNLKAVLVNVLLLQDVSLPNNIYDDPLWSIAVECRMYLAFPLLVWVLRRSGPGAMVCMAAAAGYALTAIIFLWAPQCLLACPWYLLLFTLGICAAVISFSSSIEPRRHQAALTGVILVAGAMLVLLLSLYPITPQDGSRFGRHMPVIDAATGLLAAALLAALSRPAARKPWTLLEAALSWPPLVFLGQMSFSLYLVHLPCLRVLIQGLNGVSVYSSATPLVRFAILAVVGLPLILIASYRFFLSCERPFFNAPVREKFASKDLALS